MEVSKKIIGHDKIIEERNKELNCIYKVSNLLKISNKSIDEIIKEMLYLIQSAMEFPSLNCVMIKVNEHEYKTQNFRKTAWKISTNISDIETEILIEALQSIQQGKDYDFQNIRQKYDEYFRKWKPPE